MNYRELLREARSNKFQLLKERNMVECAYHPSEGCDLCLYKLKCVIKGGN